MLAKHVVIPMSSATLQAPKSKVDIKCFHCGDPCVSIIRSDDKVFCCDGCKAVYEILNSNELCDYYTLTNHPGFTAKEKNAKARFDFLDQPDIADKLLTFKSDALNVVQFYVPKIHCASCIWLLENLQKLVDGVIDSRVDFGNKEVTVQFDPSKTHLRAVAEMMDRIGYEPEFNLQMLEKKARSTYNRTILYKIGLVGFCFGNIMLLSFPEYLAGRGGIDPLLSKAFNYLTIVLALPVLFYGASEYFANTWKALRSKQFTIDMPIAIGLLAMTFRSLVNIIGETGPGYFDSLSGLVFFLLLGRYLQDATYFRLSFDRTFKSYFPLSVRVKRGDAFDAIPVSDVAKGDKLLLNPGELLPCDGYLLSTNASLDYSFVTGEAEPIHKNIGELVYAGGRLRSAQATMEVAKPVSQSYLTQLWNNQAFGKQTHATYSDLANKLSKWFTYFILTASAGVWAYWHFVVGDASMAVFTFTTVLIVACPCALAMTVPFVWGNAMRRMSKSGFYCKHTSVLETLTKCDTVVFDKTGTLTLNAPRVIEYIGPQLTETDKLAIASLAAHSLHPMSRAVSRHFDVNTNLPEVNGLVEKPGLGVEGYVNGVLYRIGSEKFTNSNPVVKQSEDDEPRSIVFVQIDNQPVGRFELTTDLREGMRRLLAHLRHRDIDIHLLSGDTGGDAARFKHAFGNHRLHYHQSPESKLHFIKQLQDKGKTVMMVGDGLNDAGSLKQADVGIAVTDDVHVFTPASDVIIKGNQLRNLHKFISYSKFGQRLIVGIFWYSIMYNMVGLVLGAQGLFSPMIAAIIMPMSSLSVIGATYIGTWLKAKRLGV